jgi:hypothetical protein
MQRIFRSFISGIPFSSVRRQQQEEGKIFFLMPPAMTGLSQCPAQCPSRMSGNFAQRVPKPLCKHLAAMI